jgi:1,4-alpha-glucan branching enzyme
LEVIDIKKGAFTFILHSHLPYCRKAGRWPHGEEWIHEALSETYVPLLDALYDLVAENCRFKLTIGLTPVLVEQLSDPLVLSHFQEFIKDKIMRAGNDKKRFEQNGELHCAFLAEFYLNYYEHIEDVFTNRFGGNIIAAFKKIQDDGYVEILTSAATHGYLPLLERDSSIYGQLKTGIDAYSRHFGRAPAAIWLPECGYRPAFYTSKEFGAYIKPGIEQFLAELKLGLFFSETHSVEGGDPVGKATGAVIGAYGNIPRRYVVPRDKYNEPTLKTTFLPYWVQSVEVAVIGRNNRTGMQVWSADWGYPGDFDYREFHKKDGISGLQYWRVTGARIDLGEKDYYHPEWAEQKVQQHSAHYAALVTDLINEFKANTGKYGIIAAAYDTELFGHWWFEGISWLKQVLKQLSESDVVDLMTATEYITEHPPEDVLAIRESSWGQAGNHFTWMNVDTEWMWPLIHEAERKMENLVDLYPVVRGELSEILNQAGRELLLLESSDWPFLITTGQAGEYASNRFREHLDRFNKLVELAEAGKIDRESLNVCRDYYELDNIFPNMDYRVFGERELKK